MGGDLKTIDHKITLVFGEIEEYTPPKTRSWNMWELREAIPRPEPLFKVSKASKPCEDFELNASNLAAFVLADFSIIFILNLIILFE